VAGNQAFNFIGATAFSNVAGQLRYDAGALQGDIDGNGAADFTITLTGNPSLLVSDIIL
jgi:serralysin